MIRSAERKTKDYEYKITSSLHQCSTLEPHRNHYPHRQTVNGSDRRTYGCSQPVDGSLYSGYRKDSQLPDSRMRRLSIGGGRARRGKEEKEIVTEKERFQTESNPGTQIERETQRRSKKEVS